MIQVKEYKPKTKYNIRKKLESKKYSVQFLPESLNQESLHKNFTFKEQKLKTAYLVDIVHNLILKYYFKKENLFNLSSIVLKEKYGFRYNYYMDYLVSKGILKLVKRHLKGKNARIYKLDDGVINGKITRYKNEDSILLKKYKNAVSLIESQDIQSNTINPDVKRKLVDDLFHIQIEFDKAIFFLDSTLQDIDIYNRNKYSVECINDKHIFYHFDGYGRMHTNFTILKSFIRKNCLLIDGEETSEIDIKNSQPLFLCKLIESDGLSIVSENEFELFKFLTYNGKFYQYLMDNSKFKERKVIKEMIYKVLFGKNFRSKADDLFKSLFPTIHEFIRTYKKEHDNYRILAHDLQNLESNLVFNKIVKEIMYIYPEINLITVHDSIICKSKYRDIVEKIFNQNLEKEFQKIIK
jgi:hypothetical protein